MKSSNIISIGNISNLNRNTQEEINLSFLWKVDLIHIPRLHPNLNFCSQRGK
jgi:hypothetical protein